MANHSSKLFISLADEKQILFADERTGKNCSLYQPRRKWVFIWVMKKFCFLLKTQLLLFFKWFQIRGEHDYFLFSIIHVNGRYEIVQQRKT